MVYVTWCSSIDIADLNYKQACVCIFLEAKEINFDIFVLAPSFIKSKLCSEYGF